MNALLGSADTLSLSRAALRQRPSHLGPLPVRTAAALRSAPPALPLPAPVCGGPAVVDQCLEQGLQSPAVVDAKLQADQTKLGAARMAVGTPGNVTTAFSLAQEANVYLRAGFMASMAPESSPWSTDSVASGLTADIGDSPLTRAAPRPVQHLGNLGAFLALPAGLFGTGIGLAEIERGHKLQGSKDLAIAGLTTLSGVASLSATVARTVNTGLRSVGATALADPGEVGVGPGAPIGGIASILGGSFQLADALRKHKTEAAVEGGAQIAGGSLLTASAFAEGTIIGAPAGLVLGALGGVVLFGTAVVQNRHAIARGLSWLGRQFQVAVDPVH